MKKLLAIFALCLFPLNSFSETVSTISSDSQANGVANGFGVGGTVFETWGFTYRQYFSSRWGLSISLGPWIQNGHGRLGFAVGPTLTLAHYKFPKSALPHSSIRVYLVGYLSTIYNFHKQNNEIRGVRLESIQHSLGLGAGIGPGIEYFFTENFALHAELPWMIMTETTSRKGMLFSSSYPHFGGGLTYYF